MPLWEENLVPFLLMRRQKAPTERQPILFLVASAFILLLISSSTSPPQLFLGPYIVNGRYSAPHIKKKAPL